MSAWTSLTCLSCLSLQQFSLMAFNRGEMQKCFIHFNCYFSLFSITFKSLSIQLKTFADSFLKNVRDRAFQIRLNIYWEPFHHCLKVLTDRQRDTETWWGWNGSYSRPGRSLNPTEVIWKTFEVKCLCVPVTKQWSRKQERSQCIGHSRRLTCRSRMAKFI